MATPPASLVQLHAAGFFKAGWGLEPSQMPDIKRLRAWEPGVSVNADQLIEVLLWPLCRPPSSLG